LVTGLPKISDYRDLPYIWKKGFCKMNVSTLRKRLKRSTTLILGDVKDTVPIFLERDFSPIGFIAFDLDYYTSTKFALRIFHTIENNLLPRIFCYFDNIIGTDEEIMCEFTGEQLSIREFNNIHKNKKIAKISGLYHKRIIKSTWSDMVYVMHSFKHTLYNRYIYPSEDRQDNLN